MSEYQKFQTSGSKLQVAIPAAKEKIPNKI
jgi:hypothetical protein